MKYKGHLMVQDHLRITFDTLSFTFFNNPALDTSKLADQATLRMNRAFLGVFSQDTKDPLLDFPYLEDPPLDLTPKESKASCGMHQEGPTLGGTVG